MTVKSLAKSINKWNKSILITTRENNTSNKIVKLVTLASLAFRAILRGVIHSFIRSPNLFMNMMKYCPECYKELPPDTTSCPFCGYKTDAGISSEPEPPKILKTPKTDSYIPPEQITLSLLLLLIFFWGINIALTILPIFIDAGSTKNLIIAAITSQVLTRVLIGVWANEEQSLKKDQTPSKKLGSFLLTFIPIGAIYSFLAAARTMIRRDHLSHISIAAIASATIMVILLCSTADEISALIPGVDLGPGAGYILKDPTQRANNARTITAMPTITLRAYQDGCRNPASITADEEGKTRDVCGKITNFGLIECESCPKKYYSFVKLDNDFQIISYHWRFSFVWRGRCVRVSDKVEILGEDPAFVFDKSEGCKGKECEIDTNGELMNDSGIYFQDYFECE